MGHLSMCCSFLNHLITSAIWKNEKHLLVQIFNCVFLHSKLHMNTFVGLYQNIFNNSISMISTSVFHKTCPILMKQFYNRIQETPRRLSPGDLAQETPKRHPRDTQETFSHALGSSQGRLRVVQGSSKGRPKVVQDSFQNCLISLVSKLFFQNN